MTGVIENIYLKHGSYHMSLAAILAKYRDLNTICVGDRCQVIHDLGERELRQMPAEAPHVLRSEQVRFVH